MDDAQKRAEQFNTEQRIAELEAEIRRLRKTLPDRLQAMMDQAEADGLYEKLDVTLEQVRIVELEEKVASLNDLVKRMSKSHRKSAKELKQSLRALIAHAEGTRKITSAQLARARWRLHDQPSLGDET